MVPRRREVRLGGLARGVAADAHAVEVDAGVEEGLARLARLPLQPLGEVLGLPLVAQGRHLEAVVALLGGGRGGLDLERRGHCHGPACRRRRPAAPRSRGTSPNPRSLARPTLTSRGCPGRASGGGVSSGSRGTGSRSSASCGAGRWSRGRLGSRLAAVAAAGGRPWGACARGFGRSRRAIRASDDDGDELHFTRSAPRVRGGSRRGVSLRTRATREPARTVARRAWGSP